MDFRILGPLEVWDGERQLDLGGSKRRALLAFLLLHANEVVSTDRLVDQLWGANAPRNAAAALQTHVSRLRKELGPDAVATRAWGYVLRTDPGTIDLERFGRLVANAENLPARERAEKLGEAVALWRGRPLEDLVFEPALAKDIARLEELRLAVLENRIDADLESGNHLAVIGELETLIAENPLRERLRGQLILALYRSGRQAEALEVYRETRRVLADELGLEPSPELRELERAILQQDPALTPPARLVQRIEVQHKSPGRRRRLFGLATVLALLVGGGLAAYAATHNGPRVHRIAAAPARSPAAATRQTTTILVIQPKAATTPSRAQPRASRHADATHHPRPRTIRPRENPVRSPPITTRTRVTSQHRVRIADAFSSNVVNGAIWNVIREGTGFDVGQSGGRLVWNFPSTATPAGAFSDVGGHYGTQCRFPGNFDARVDYALAQWPAGNGVVTALSAFFGPKNYGTQVTRSSSLQGGEQYTSYLSPTTGAGAVTDDLLGSLRITRVDEVVTMYFRHSGTWHELAAEPVGGAAVIGIGAYSPSGDWQGKPVTVAFDNFVVTAPKAICPPGAEPRSTGR
jgi:DNA-binding SARP family transcriptional activator